MVSGLSWKGFMANANKKLVGTGFNI